MKSASQILLLIHAIFISMTSAHALPPREELMQMVQLLQKTPTDNALREKIIKLAKEVRPAPAFPEDAQRRMVRGTTAFKDAKTTTDYQDAAREFEQASLAAPWHGDVYFNLGVALDKAEQYESALRCLRLAQLAAPDSKEIKDLIYQVEYRNEKAHTRAVALHRPSGPDFSGGWEGPKSWDKFFIEKNTDGWIVRDYNRKPLRVVKAQGRQLWIEDLDDTTTVHYEFVLAENGQTINVAKKVTQSADQFNVMQSRAPGKKFLDLDVSKHFVLRRN